MTHSERASTVADLALLEQRHLADDRARPEMGEDDLVAKVRRGVHFEFARLDHVERTGLITLREESFSRFDRLLIGDAHDLPHLFSGEAAEEICLREEIFCVERRVDLRIRSGSEWSRVFRKFR